MENQLVGVSPWTIIALWFFVVVVIVVISLLLVSQWRHYKQIQDINNWEDTVSRELANIWRKFYLSDLNALKMFVNENAGKTKTNLQLITDKINEMNGYHNGKDEAPIVESVQGTEKTPVLQKETAPKEVVEGNETLPDNVIQFPGPKKPK